MVLANFDLFGAYRACLSVFVAAYTTIRIAQFAWHWQLETLRAGRGESLLRRYAVVQLLRVKLRRFAFDFVQIALLLAAIVLLLGRHGR